MLRWSAISGSSLVWTEGPLAGEYLRGAIHPTLAKQVYEYSSEELMNKADKSAVWSQHERILTLRAVNKELKLGGNQELLAVAEHRAKEYEDEAKKLRAELEYLRNLRRELEEEVGVLHSNLDGARNDRARLEGDVLSLTEAAVFLKAELKVEGPKVVIAYKASRGFELGLEKMGRVNYEYRYQVALEQLRGKHPEIAIEQDPFVECPDDANMEMDLNQSFDDSAPSEIPVSDDSNDAVQTLPSWGKLPAEVPGIADLGLPEDQVSYADRQAPDRKRGNFVLCVWATLSYIE
ncbi:hypothetical protein GW17_00016977 [Ensete ventricosum]|nr:hypothetical protein GW17_00016977 [Ensete ventricosum]